MRHVLHGISRLPEAEGAKPAKKKFKPYPIGYFHIDIAEVRTAEGKDSLRLRKKAAAWDDDFLASIVTA